MCPLISMYECLFVFSSILALFSFSRPFKQKSKDCKLKSLCIMLQSLNSRVKAILNNRQKTVFSAFNKKSENRS